MARSCYARCPRQWPFFRSFTWPRERSGAESSCSATHCRRSEPNNRTTEASFGKHAVAITHFSRDSSPQDRTHHERDRRKSGISQRDTGSTRYKRPEGGPSRTGRATPRALLATRPDNAPAGSRTPHQEHGYRCIAEGIKHRHHETLAATDSHERPRGARVTRPKRYSLVWLHRSRQPGSRSCGYEVCFGERGNEKGSDLA